MTSVRAALVPSLVESFACTRYHLYTGHPLLSQHSEIACEPIARTLELPVLGARRGGFAALVEAAGAEGERRSLHGAGCSGN